MEAQMVGVGDFPALFVGLVGVIGMLAIAVSAARADRSLAPTAWVGWKYWCWGLTTVAAMFAVLSVPVLVTTVISWWFGRSSTLALSFVAVSAVAALLLAVVAPRWRETALTGVDLEGRLADQLHAKVRLSSLARPPRVTLRTLCGLTAAHVVLGVILVLAVARAAEHLWPTGVVLAGYFAAGALIYSLGLGYPLLWLSAYLTSWWASSTANRWWSVAHLVAIGLPVSYVSLLWASTSLGIGRAWVDRSPWLVAAVGVVAGVNALVLWLLVVPRFRPSWGFVPSPVVAQIAERTGDRLIAQLETELEDHRLCAEYEARLAESASRLGARAT